MKNSFSLLDKFSNQTAEIIQKIYECIKITLGPTGKNGIVASQTQSIKILTNGSILMKSLEFSSRSANILVKLLEQASLKTIQISGDGSTTTLLLSCEILQNCFPFLTNGYNSIFLSNGLKKISFFVNEKVLESSLPITSRHQLNGVLTTAIGKKIHPHVLSNLKDCVQQIERDGLILVEENNKPETEIEVVQGIELDKGFASSYFINDLKKFEVIYENPYLLIANSPINSLNQLSEIIEFADIRGFIDAPMYTYSAGMQLRLGFSIAIAADPEILLLDEGIAVGDENFQRKSGKKIEEFYKQKKTIILVSHWLEHLKEHCQRIIWMEDGKIKADGNLRILDDYSREG